MRFAANILIFALILLFSCEKRKHCKGIKGIVYESPIKVVEMNGCYYESSFQKPNTYPNSNPNGLLPMYNDSISFYSDFNIAGGCPLIDFSKETVIIFDFSQCDNDKKWGIKFELLDSETLKPTLKITRCGMKNGAEGCGSIFNKHSSGNSEKSYFIITDKLISNIIYYEIKTY